MLLRTISKIKNKIILILFSISKNFKTNRTFQTKVLQQLDGKQI